MLGAARVQPLVVATEDLHWADASTLELIQLLVEQGATARPAAPIHGATRVSRPMAAACALYADHAQPAERTQRARDGRGGGCETLGGAQCSRAKESATCALNPMSDETNLADAELIYVRGIAPDATYQFKHALIRDAAYEALLKSRRKELHRQVAIAIDETFPALKEAHPELLARHWTKAGEAEPAIAEWTTAGKAAEARNAFKEALESYQQALALLRTLADTPARIHQELTLQTALGLALVMTKGLGAPEVREASDYARKLCENQLFACAGPR